MNLAKILILILILFLLLSSGCPEGKKPNLVIKDLEYRGEGSGIYITIANEGEGRAEDIVIYIYDGDLLLGSIEPSIALLGGAKVTVRNADIILEEGIHTIRAKIDPENNIDESNEQDNEFIKEIEISEADPCRNVTCVSSKKCVDGTCVLKTCSERNGDICTDNEECSAEFIASSDSERCCQEECTEIVEEETLEEILAKSDNIVGMKYDVHSTVTYIETGGTIELTSIVWEEGEKIRSETEILGSPWIVIYDGADYYTWNSEKEAFVETTAFTTHESAFIFIDEVRAADDVEIIGDETVDGKDTKVVEFTKTPSETIRMWIWKEKGVPIKREKTTSTTVEVIEMSNFVFGDVDDSKFVADPIYVPGYCGDEICESVEGENQANCSIDCGVGEFNLTVTVIDSVTRQPIEEAFVDVHDNAYSPYTSFGGGNTDSEGVFIAYKLPEGQYYIQTSKTPDYQISWGSDNPLYVDSTKSITIELVPV